LAAVAVFLVRVTPWLLSDLWYDEIVTLTDFAIGPRHDASILHVFRSYPVANNHVLFSAVAWCWVRFLQFSSAEYLLRMPSVAFGVLTLLWILRDWPKWLGQRVAGVTAVLFAMSPVFCGFSWQLRGYSLSMLLGAVAVSGVMELTTGSHRRGLLLSVPAAFLLPLVIPTNALLPAALLLVPVFLGAGDPSLAVRVRRVAPVAVATLLGCSYYLTILPQFLHAAKETQGWPNGWLVFGNVLLGLLAHLGPLLLLFAGRGRAVLRPPDASVESWARLRLGWVLLLAGLVVVLVFVLALPSPPFPRVFLVFVPALSLAVMLGVRDLGFWSRVQPLMLIGLVVMHGYVWDRATTWLTQQQMRQGKYPQNLVQQFYRGDTELSGICRKVRAGEWRDRLVVIVAEHDFPTFRYYWGLYMMDPALVLEGNDQARRKWGEQFAGRGYAIGAVALDEMAASRLFGILDGSMSFAVQHQAGGRALYVAVRPDAP